jgi:hypothetical protein
MGPSYISLFLFYWCLLLHLDIECKQDNVYYNNGLLGAYFCQLHHWYASSYFNYPCFSEKNTASKTRNQSNHNLRTYLFFFIFPRRISGETSLH